mgnify:FL=1
MSMHYEWLMHPLNIEYLQKPKPIDKLPFQKVWVFDNYLTPSIWWSWINWRNSSINWGRSNRVIRNDEMQHLYWGESIYHNIGEVRNRNSEIQEYYESYHRQNKRWIKQSEWKKNVFRVNNVGYREPIIDWFIHKLRQDFRFDWNYFQYCGFNGQTIGQDGTIHEDTGLDESCLNNLTFLYYDQKRWEDDWGGDLIMYNGEYHDHSYNGIPENAEDYEIGRVKYKPNRLVIMNGAITHRHPGPEVDYTKENGFPFRTSMVVRGDKATLWDA